MAIPPFSKPRRVSGYAAPSGPGSKGRMPLRHTEARETLEFNPPPIEQAPEVDGSLRGHDTSYARTKPLTYSEPI
jgi:hypothetical protein